MKLFLSPVGKALLVLLKHEEGWKASRFNALVFVTHELFHEKSQTSIKLEASLHYWSLRCNGKELGFWDRRAIWPIFKRLVNAEADAEDAQALERLLSAAAKASPEA